jgi:triosephosphate isomerase
MSKKIIIANWKMNPRTVKDAEKLFKTVAKNVSRVKKTDVVICAPFTYLEELSEVRTSKIALGAQDAYPGDVGASTGEVSAQMLYDMKVRYVILGHSERRSPPAGGGETNELVNKKIKGALQSGLKPILCVGESERDENHGYFNLVKSQLEECLAGISRNLISKIIIAYEPIWAISSTLNHKDAAPEDSREMAVFIRKVLSDKFGSDGAKVKILYGGSVNEKDAEGFLKDGGVDGALVGKASLDIKKFTNIVMIAENI